jgi:hypothetical protein
MCCCSWHVLTWCPGAEDAVRITQKVTHAHPTNLDSTLQITTQALFGYSSKIRARVFFTLAL